MIKTSATPARDKEAAPEAEHINYRICCCCCCCYSCCIVVVVVVVVVVVFVVRKKSYGRYRDVVRTRKFALAMYPSFQITLSSQEMLDQPPKTEVKN